MRELVALGAAYLLGSVPTAYLISRWAGKDIRVTGSGNVGTANALRNVGTYAGIVTLLGDLAKGFLAVLAAGALAPDAGWVQVFSLAGVVAGHNWVPWLGFRGGKGLACLAGGLLALAPETILHGLVAMGVWAIALKDAGTAAAMAALSLPLILWLHSGKAVTRSEEAHV